MKFNNSEIEALVSAIADEVIKKIIFHVPGIDLETEKQEEQKRESKTKKENERKRAFGRKGGCYGGYAGTETEYDIMNRIVADHPEIRLRNEDEIFVRTKRGVLCCENAALYMIHKGADNGKLFSEVLDVAIAARMHEYGFGLSAPALIMLFRVLCLHSYKHEKVKELLIDIMRKNTVNSITVLAKATEKYTQRKVGDMRVMYIESLLAEYPGIRNQFSA